MSAPVRLLANCVVGLGFSRRAFEAALDLGPDLIGCDAGSADFGPFYLGSGRDSKSSLSVARDLRIMLDGARRIDVPLVLGSCGGAGAAPHVAGYRRLVQEWAAERGQRLRLAVIHADQQPEVLHAAIAEHRVQPLGEFPVLTHAAVDASTAVVAMMGTGPLMSALQAGADVILAGRCADPAIFACAALRAGVPEGVAWHAAKSIDKGYLCTDQPAAGSPVLATLDAESFTVEPVKPGVRCTTKTVAAVTMHENPDPFVVQQPSGAIDVGEATYEQLDERRVRVTGSRWRPAARPSVKLEGARPSGYRAVLLAGLRDPRLLEVIDEFLAAYRQLLERIARSLGAAPSAYSVRFLPYGHGAVLGALEWDRRTAKEIGLVVDVVAETQSLATALAGRAGPTGSRLDVTGKLGGGGNFAYPFSPAVLELGQVYEWSVWHVMELEDECEPFRVEIVDL